MTAIVDREDAGGKLRGLLQLPSNWVPSFFSLSSALHERYLRSFHPVGIADILFPEEAAEIERRVLDFGPSPEDLSLIVRSNGIEEGLEERGLLTSFRTDGTVDGLLAAALKVFAAAAQLKKHTPIGLLVQVYQSPTLWGYFANARRVSEETRRWICEMYPSKGAAAPVLPEVFGIRVERVRPAVNSPLTCEARAQLLDQLRAVGRYFYDKGERRHLEWTWTGDRLWIVQSDLAPDPTGESPEPSKSLAISPVDSGRLRAFRPYSASDARRWQKLDCVEKFNSAGLPVTSLYVLQGAKIIDALARKEVPEPVVKDLNELTKSPLVIRSDVAGETKLFAPRTDSVSTQRNALEFLQDASEKLESAGVKARDVCFIAHRFIPALAAAFSLATPSAPRVRIDSLWGLPDGLEFCPHDSFEIDARSGAQVARRIRYKPLFLADSEGGKWKMRQLSPPWDWKPSTDDEDLRSISRVSKNLADLVGKALVIMWFVGVLENSGHPKLIPWRYTTEDTPRQIESAVSSHFQREPFFVKNDGDLDRLQSATTPISSVVLRPDGPHLRDEAFLQRLGAVVGNKGIRIDLEGSPLSHAYYVLRRTGSNVACVDPINTSIVKRRFQKLVRDRIPVQIRRRGERVAEVALRDDELVDVLKAKIVEEALEVLAANSPEALHEEMADVFEVLRALCRATRRSSAQLKRDADKKRSKLGGFTKGIVLVETEETPLVAVKTESGLFEPLRTTVRTPSPNTIIAAGRRPKTQQDRIIIPLVPSAQSRLRGPTRVQLRSAGLSFRVRYTEKSVEVVLERERKVSNDAQLSLFPPGETTVTPNLD
jgi:predicted house-cleaning noncanonical NTP pyrophosphatase (MazG superfamily)